jgi:outer membrane receptor protein involved in Fe transport
MRYLFSFFFFFASSSIIFSQSKNINLSGYILDKSSGEPLVSAIIGIPNTQTVASSNVFGYFSLTIPELSIKKLEVQYIGFQNYHITIQPTQDTSINIYLTPNLLEEVTIKATPNRLKSNVVNIPIERLKAIPSLFGQPDIIKALSFVPGVSTGTEGTTGLFVRGGTPDQNLILLDGSTVYNASHLFGFQSVFDPAAIKDVKLIKGGFPARYGGRLSSVIDITMKEGNNQERHSEASIGLINSSFMTEGPIKKGTSSYMLSGRASYWGILLLPTYFASKNKEDKPFTTIWSNDLNLKINHQIKNGDKIFASFYLGDDKLNARFKSSNDYFQNALNWGNRTGSIRYIHSFHKRLFANTLL